MTEPDRTDAAHTAAQPDAAAPRVMPGARLAQARGARGLSLESVAQQLKFSPRQIDALEGDRYDELPGIAVVRGMVRGYARLVEMDPAPLLESLKDAVPAPDANRIAARYREPVPFSDASKRSNAVYVVFTLAVLAVAALVLVQWRQERPEPEARMTFVAPATVSPSSRTTVASAGGAATPLIEAPARSPADAVAPAAPAAVQPPAAGSASSGASDAPAEAAAADDAPAVVPAAAAETASAAAASEAATPAAGTPAADPGQRVRLEFIEQAWVEIRDADGKLLHAQLNAAGSEVRVAGKAPLSFVIGNAQFVRLEVDGRSVDLTPYIKVAVARFTLP
jgi:cytoskeleton protein RodZ